MKNTKTLWTAGLALLACASGVAWWYTVNFMKWNVPLYGVGMAILSSTEGLSAAVLCDGEKAGELNCSSIYGNMEFPAGTVTLPDDGQTHTVTVRIDDPSDEAICSASGI